MKTTYFVGFFVVLIGTLALTSCDVVNWLKSTPKPRVTVSPTPSPVSTPSSTPSPKPVHTYDQTTTANTAFGNGFVASLSTSDNSLSAYYVLTSFDVPTNTAVFTCHLVSYSDSGYVLNGVFDVTMNLTTYATSMNGSVALTGGIVKGLSINSVSSSPTSGTMGYTFTDNSVYLFDQATSNFY